MASPQKENGHLDLANEIVEAMAQTHLTPNEHKLLYAVWRKTWCWHKKEDWISLTQIEELTKLNRMAVCRAKKSLISKMILLTNKNKISFNKNYHQWVVSKPILLNQYQYRQQVVSISAISSINIDTHKRKYTKETYTKEELDKNMKLIRDKIHKKLI